MLDIFYQILAVAKDVRMRDFIMKTRSVIAFMLIAILFQVQSASGSHIIDSDFEFESDKNLGSRVSISNSGRSIFSNGLKPTSETGDSMNIPNWNLHEANILETTRGPEPELDGSPNSIDSFHAGANSDQSSNLMLPPSMNFTQPDKNSTTFDSDNSGDLTSSIEPGSQEHGIPLMFLKPEHEESTDKTTFSNSDSTEVSSTTDMTDVISTEFNSSPLTSEESWVESDLATTTVDPDAGYPGSSTDGDFSVASVVEHPGNSGSDNRSTNLLAILGVFCISWL